MVSEHASPLAVLGGVDAGGQNVHVAALATALAERGDEVVVHTRRDEAKLPRRVTLAPGVEVDHVDAGPPSEVPKDELLPYMAAFADDLREQWSEDRPDVVHSHFWMSAVAALGAAAPLGIPVVHTFHALGTVKRRHQGEHDTSPPSGTGSSARSVRARAPDRRHLLRTRSSSSSAWAPTGAASPSCPAAWIATASSRTGRLRAAPARPPRIVAACRLVTRKGIADAVRALAELPDTELHVAGGPDASQLALDPEAQRLVALAGLARHRRPARPARPRLPRAASRAAALGRRRGLRPLVRAVRDRPARGDGLRRARRSPAPWAGRSIRWSTA
jgi:glycosyltransferase involved in cell wall biosynthesis